PVTASGGVRDLLRSSKQDDLLHPDKAFRFGASMLDAGVIALTWIIADGYYLYKDQVREATSTPDVQVGAPVLPQGTPQHDEYFGDTAVHYDTLEATVPVARPARDARLLNLLVTYQGCAVGGLCYNPVTRNVSPELPPSATATLLTMAPALSAPPPAGSARGAVAEQDRLASVIRDGNLFVVLATFFGIGLLLSLTPCVLPMIPILSGIIVGQGERVTPLRGFSLAFTYVQGMALTYAAAGAAFVLAFKQAPQAFFQQ